MDPQLYIKGNSLQNSVVNKALDEILSKLHLQDNSTLLDVGCGDGNVLINILLKRLPINYRHCIGVDIAPEMVEFCRKRAASKSNIDIYKMDIACKIIPEKYENYFNYIFSFNTLHWVPNQRKAFSNIYDMLTDDGEIFLLIQGKNQFFDSWELLEKQEPWKHYLGDIKEFFTPYQNCKDPEMEVKTMLQKLDFINYQVEYKSDKYIFENITSFKDFLRPITVFLNRIPLDLQEKFLDRSVEEVIKFSKKSNDCSNNELAKDGVTFYFNYLYVYAQKKTIII